LVWGLGAEHGVQDVDAASREAPLVRRQYLAARTPQRSGCTNTEIMVVGLEHCAIRQALPDVSAHRR